MEISPRAFALVCYLVIMDHHGMGYIEAHPGYLEEKFSIVNLGYLAAYSWLDSENQQKVLDYLTHWKFEIPDAIKSI